MEEEESTLDRGRRARGIPVGTPNLVESVEAPAESFLEEQAHPDLTARGGAPVKVRSSDSLRSPSATRQSPARRKFCGVQLLRLRDSRLCVPASRQVCPYRVQSLLEKIIAAKCSHQD